MDDMARIAARIAAQLRDIRGSQSSLVVDVGEVFYQMASYEGDAVLIETVSNEFLSPELRLRPEQEGRLLRLGFTRPSRDMPNWWIDIDDGLDDEIDQAARAVTAALVEVYGMPVDTVDAGAATASRAEGRAR